MCQCQSQTQTQNQLLELNNAVTGRIRHSRNPRLRNTQLVSHADVGAGLQVLDKHADEAVPSAASALFLSTAGLQGGRLDVLVVLADQTRLIWRVANV
jgi:hypothetical protein